MKIDDEDEAVAQLKAELEALKAEIVAGMVAESSAPRLKGCPFCGNSNIKITEKRRGNYRREGDNYQGLCSKCRGRGPLVQDSPSAAAIAWNSRTEQS